MIRTYSWFACEWVPCTVCTLLLVSAWNLLKREFATCSLLQVHQKNTVSSLHCLLPELVLTFTICFTCNTRKVQVQDVPWQHQPADDTSQRIVTSTIDHPPLCSRAPFILALPLISFLSRSNTASLQGHTVLLRQLQRSFVTTSSADLLSFIYYKLLQIYYAIYFNYSLGYNSYKLVHRTGQDRRHINYYVKVSPALDCI